MAQLSSDWAAFGETMRSVDDAVATIMSSLVAVEGVEAVPLVEADGRILADDLIAPMALPPFTNSAVDGYATRAADLSIVEEVLDD